MSGVRGTSRPLKRRKIPPTDGQAACAGRTLGLAFAALPMADAVIRTGGKQYRVAEGDLVRVEKLDGAAGDKVSFDEVLFLGGDSPKFGSPLVSGAKVSGEIVSQGRGEKIIIFKFKRRKKYRRKQGHRQSFTAVKITEVQG